MVSDHNPAYAQMLGNMAGSTHQAVFAEARVALELTQLTMGNQLNWRKPCNGSGKKRLLHQVSSVCSWKGENTSGAHEAQVNRKLEEYQRVWTPISGNCFRRRVAKLN